MDSMRYGITHTWTAIAHRKVGSVLYKTILQVYDLNCSSKM